MKFLKIMAALMAVCMLGSAMLACGKKDDDKDNKQESETQPAQKITVSLLIEAPAGSKGEDIEKSCIAEFESKTLGEVIEYCCDIYQLNTEEEPPFEEIGGVKMLKTINGWEPKEGQKWSAYLKDSQTGIDLNSPLDPYSQTIEDGQTYVIKIVNVQ